MRKQLQVYRGGYGLPVTDFGRVYGDLDAATKHNLEINGNIKTARPASSKVKKTYTPVDGQNFLKVMNELQTTTGATTADLAGWLIRGPGGYLWYIVNPNQILLLTAKWDTTPPTKTPDPYPKSGLLDNFPSMGVTPSPHPAEVTSNQQQAPVDWVFPVAVGGSILVALVGVALFVLRK